MRIPRVHVDTELAAGATVDLPQAQSHYLKHVLRLKPGAALRLFNGCEARDYAAVLVASGKQFGARLESSLAVATESPLDCEILQGLGRGDHMDWMIQKTTELGVRRIRLFNAARTQSPLKPKQLEKKLQHWRGVAASACEQCGRAVLPGLDFHGRFDEAISAVDSAPRLLLDVDGDPLRGLLQSPAASLVILLGPEGGLTAAEIEQAVRAGFARASLGPRVLRTETAAISALTIAQSLLGDL